MSKLKGIIYLSEATTDFDKTKLVDLAREFATRNQLIGITGYLYFVKGKFFQYIEGEGESIQNLFESIGNDSRHRIINSIQNQDISDRKFPSWSMKFITKDMLTKINMESLVMERIEYIKKVKDITRNRNGINVIEQEKSLWRMVDTISRLSNHF